MTGLGAVSASALCAAGCAYVVVAPHPRRRLLDRGIGPAPAEGGRRSSAPARGVARARAWTALAAAATLTAAVGTGSAVFAALVPLVVAVIATTLRRRHQQLARERTRVAVVDLCAALAGELRSGAPLLDALERAAQVPAAGEVIVPHALQTARSGGDVAQALREDAGAAGAEGLRALAACWEIALGSGAALAPALSRLMRGLRAEQTHRRDLSATLAAPRATARLLALLPTVGILMGTGLGVDPLGLLLGTPVGALLLATGGGLALLGLVWTDRLARAADPATTAGARSR